MLVMEKVYRGHFVNIWVIFFSQHTVNLPREAFNFVKLSICHI